jgi:hypothetical protein
MLAHRRLNVLPMHEEQKEMSRAVRALQIQTKAHRAEMDEARSGLKRWVEQDVKSIVRESLRYVVNSQDILLQYQCIATGRQHIHDTVVSEITTQAEEIIPRVFRELVPITLHEQVLENQKLLERVKVSLQNSYVPIIL